MSHQLISSRTQSLACRAEAGQHVAPLAGKLVPGVDNDRLRLAYKSGQREIVYHAAPFAAVRWTNLWFPPRLGVFGDWFGGALAPLFGSGIRDLPVTGGVLSRAPALAHTKYFSYANDVRSDSSTTRLRAALDLASTAWLHPPEPPSATATATAKAAPRKGSTPARPRSRGTTPRRL